MQNILQVEHLKKVFQTPGRPDYVAVDDVSFCIQQGEKVAIIGESGSGKTTIANLITRLLEPTDGKIIFNGQDITKCKGRELRDVYGNMQMVFQDPVQSFNPRRTLGDGIAESLVNQGIKKKDAIKEAERLLDMCELGREFYKCYPHQVSGGQCQRAAIARSLSVSPNLLVLDEATSALDVIVQKDILELLDRLQEERNMSYLFICHDIALVQMFCERVLVMHNGKIVEEGETSQVISSPKMDYTKRLIDSVL